MADSQSSHSAGGSSTGNPQPPVRAADIVETERSVQSLQSQLDRALDAGDVTGSGLLAQQIAQFKQQLRAQRQQVAASREREKEEREWESAQLHKINTIKTVVEERRRETEAVKSSLRRQLSGQRQHSGSSNNVAASSFFSVFSSKDSHSQSAQPSSAASAHSPPRLDDLLVRARKSIKETQVVLEKQTLIVDSVDMNGHPSTLHAAELPDQPHAPSLHSIKAIRKDTVQLIQSHLSHVDELEKHVGALDACLAFLDQQQLAPPSKRPATANSAVHAATRHSSQQQHFGTNGPMR